MGKLIDLTGKKFGRLTVIKRDGSDKHGKPTWLCKCECGSQKVLSGNSIRTGNTKSCGCIHREQLIQMSTTHGKRHTPEYIVWHSMMRRCEDPRHLSYKNYGGRGITVCERWRDFENFYEDMKGRPPNFTIERLDNDKGYYPENCVWASYVDQAKNRRMQSNNTSGYTGVWWNKSISKWETEITENGKRIRLGKFVDLKEAIKARKRAEKKYLSKPS